MHGGAWGYDDRDVARHAHPPAAPTLGVDGDVGRELDQVDARTRFVDHVATRHGDDLVDEVGELLRLGLEVGDDVGTITAAELGVLLEGVDVGPQAGQRGAQLVPGVLHETTLLLSCDRASATSIRSKARVRRPTSSGDAPTPSPPTDVLELPRRADVLGCRREPAERGRDAPGEPQADQRRHGRHGGGDQDRPVAQLQQDPFGLVEGTRHLHGAAFRTDRLDAIRAAVDVDRRAPTWLARPASSRVASVDTGAGEANVVSSTAPDSDSTGPRTR